MADDFATRLQIEQYMQMFGMDANGLLDQMKKDAEPRLRSTLMLEAVAKAENMEVSDGRLDEEFQKMADMYKMDVDKIKELMGEAGTKQMRSDLLLQMAAEMIGESAVEVEKKEEPEE